jgi:YggT family protein
MFILANFINALASVVDWALQIYVWMIIIRALLTWVNPDPYNPVVLFLYRATEPVLSAVRKKIPNMGGIDISPIVVILIIFFLQIFIVTTLKQLALKISASSIAGSATGAGSAAGTGMEQFEIPTKPSPF